MELELEPARVSLPFAAQLALELGLVVLHLSMGRLGGSVDWMAQDGLTGRKEINGKQQFISLRLQQLQSRVELLKTHR